MDIIVDKAGDDLFRTPLPSEIPTDSFAEDYEVQDMEAIEDDLDLTDLDSINHECSHRARKVQIAGGECA